MNFEEARLKELEERFKIRKKELEEALKENKIAITLKIFFKLYKIPLK